MRLEEELKMEKFINEFQRATLNVIFTGMWLTDKINSLLKPFGLSEQQYNVLRILKGQKGKPINLFSIQERMLHRMSNATRLVEKLRQKNYVERITCEDNRRKVEITITKSGLELLKKVDVELRKTDHIKKLETTWTEKEAKMIGDMLDKLRE